MKTHKLFVYGTLKQGFRNHHFLKGAKFLGELALERFQIIDLGGFPGLVRGWDGTEVHGELYEITEDMLPALDRLENVPYLYTREEHPDGFFYYLYNVGECGYSQAPIESGKWE